MAQVLSRFRVTDPDTGEVRIYLPGHEVTGADEKVGCDLGAVAATKAMKPKENK